MTTRFKLVNIRALSRITLVGALVLGLTGCILRATGGFVTVDDLGTFIQLRFDDVSVAYCRDVTLPNGNMTNECEYSIESEDGFADRTSTTELISQFGVVGILIDPVIVQVPESATFETATVDDGNGAQDLRVTETSSFTVTPGVQSSAEAGHKFWIIELPLALEATLPESPQAAEFDFVFEYRGPVEPDNSASFKAIYAGRAEANGETYYVPLYPCTADFSQVPSFDIPVFPGASIPLNAFIFELLEVFGPITSNLGCVNQVYDFTEDTTPPTPLACDVDGDDDVDRIDIGQIFAARNTAADPGDPRDNDGDGTITVLDARQCVANCTLARCAIQ